MKKKNNILTKVTLYTSLFFLLLTVFGGLLFYYGSRTSFLKAKDEMIKNDLRREEKNLRSLKSVDWLIDYWDIHRNEIVRPLADSEYDDLIKWEASLNTQELSEAIKTAPPEIKAAYAVDCYSTYKFESDLRIEDYDYTKINYLGINDDGSPYILFDSNKYTDDAPIDLSLGDKPSFNLKKHKVLKNLLNTSNSKIRFEIVSNPSIGENYYWGYKPVIIDGKLKCIICASYNWNAFKKTLVDNITFLIIINTVLLLLSIVIMMMIFNHSIIRPIKTMQKGLLAYTKTKDKDRFIETVNNIHSNNELENLAYNMSSLSTELDKYINDLKDSKQALRDFTKDVMEALAQTIDAKDKYTNGHSSRVAIYSRMIGKQMGLSLEDQDMLYYMGLLHDIGKIGIPDEIINKTSKLSDEEFNLIQSHPIFGYDILSEISSHPELAQAARWHHEHYDGTGYPDKLSGEDIPFMVRIVAVADSYDAMTSNRSYRKYLPQDVARDEIKKHAGTQFDPDVAECMVRIIEEDVHYMLHE